MNTNTPAIHRIPYLQAKSEVALLDREPVDVIDQVDVIQAKNDIEAAWMWLHAKGTNPKTKRVMRKEMERFILWALHTQGKQISQITVMDITQYISFMADPQPAEVWVSHTKHKRSHPDWRPFAGPLSKASQQYALIQIGSMYKWMIQGGRLKANPVSLVAKPQVDVDLTIKRLLPEAAIGLAFEAIAATKSPLKRARDHFMLSLFYMTGVRTFEATGATMGKIRRSASGTLWLEVLGKRNKVRDVPISEDLYEDLLQYRQAFGLSREVPVKDTTPLLLASNSKLKRAHNDTILKAVKEIMHHAAALAIERSQFDLADRLEEASTHWLRHSCFSHLAKATGDLVMIKALAGHSKIETTSRYLHTEDDALHAGVVQTLSTPRLHR